MRAQPEPRLPAVLSLEEGRRLLRSATPLHHQVSVTPVSSLGRRLPEARSLQVAAMASQPMGVQGPRGKGAQDRDGPLPPETLALLRSFWKTPRTRTWLFPATGRAHTPRPRATAPLSQNRVQGACCTAP
jgi:integrase